MVGRGIAKTWLVTAARQRRKQEETRGKTLDKGAGALATMCGTFTVTARVSERDGVLTTQVTVGDGVFDFEAIRNAAQRKARALGAPFPRVLAQELHEQKRARAEDAFQLVCDALRANCARVYAVQDHRPRKQTRHNGRLAIGGLLHSTQVAKGLREWLHTRPPQPIAGVWCGCAQPPFARFEGAVDGNALSIAPFDKFCDDEFFDTHPNGRERKRKRKRERESVAMHGD